MAKDSPYIAFNLDNLDIPADSKPQRFALKGKTFQTVDLSTLEWDTFEKAWSEYQAKENPRTLVTLLLGKDAAAFWQTKPSIFQVMGLMKELEPTLKAVFGDPGESPDSVQF